MAKFKVKAIATNTKTLIRTIEAKNKKVAIARVILESKERDWKKTDKLHADVD